MLDRLLNGILWLTIMALITSTAGAALILGYRGVFGLCAGRYPTGGVALAVGVALAGGSYLLCRNANDLMDR
jgi:hypothetical protein